MGEGEYLTVVLIFISVTVTGKADFSHVSISHSFRNSITNYFFVSFSHFSARPFIFLLSCVTLHILQKPALCALASIAPQLEHQSSQRKDMGSILVKAKNPGCRFDPGPGLGACGRQPINVCVSLTSLFHFFSRLSLSPSLSLFLKCNGKNILGRGLTKK